MMQRSCGPSDSEGHVNGQNPADHGRYVLKDVTPNGR